MPTPDAPAPGTTKQRLLYVLVPHPDDEVFAWSFLEARPEDYPVLILLTRGERTAYGSGGGLREDLGERAPQPQPFDGSDPERVAQQRVDSWHWFLNEMAVVDRSLDRPAPVLSPDGGLEWDGGPSRHTVRIGARSARFVFDLGDGDLSVSDVLAALAHVRGTRGQLLPDLPEGDVVGSAYLNMADPDHYPYTHRDHRAVHEALWNHDLDLPGAQWAATYAGDPDARADGRVERVADLSWQYLVEITPEGRRLGRFQQAYGWLGFFGPDGRWLTGEHNDRETLISQVQTFWARFG